MRRTALRFGPGKTSAPRAEHLADLLRGGKTIADPEKKAIDTQNIQQIFALIR